MYPHTAIPPNSHFYDMVSITYELILISSLNSEYITISKLLLFVENTRHSYGYVFPESLCFGLLVLRSPVLSAKKEPICFFCKPLTYFIVNVHDLDCYSCK